MKVQEIARMCHEVNRAYCESLGDHSQATWENAPDWQKQSVIRGVIFHVKNPDAQARASHEQWLQEKERTGWIWGPVKDVEKKQHPCIVFERIQFHVLLKAFRPIF